MNQPNTNNIETLMNNTIKKIKVAENLSEVLPETQGDMLKIFSSEGFVVYERQSSGEAVVSVFASKMVSKDTKLPLSTHTIPGLVALAQRPVAISNIKSSMDLKKVHKNLKNFLSESGQELEISSILAVPIKPAAVTLGVLVIFNKKGKGSFSKNDLACANKLGEVIGQKFHMDLKATNAPFEHLLQTNRITILELEKLEKKAKKEEVSVASLLMKEKSIDIEEVGISLERYYLTPFMPHDSYVRIPGELVENVKDSYMRTNRWVPVSGDKEKAFILIDDPTDVQRVMEIENLLGAKHYAFMVGIKEDIERFIDHSPRADPGESSVPMALEGQLSVDGEDIDSDKPKGIMKIGMGSTAHKPSLVEEALKREEEEISDDVIKLADSIITKARNSGASDIHIQGRKDSDAVVRFRIDGACRQAMSLPAAKLKQIVARIKIMARLDIAERRKPQDGKFRTEVDGGPLELRVATVPTVFGESVVMRILAASEPLPLEKLNFSRRNLTETVNLSSRPHGIFLVVGPTGSGKTTTLHAVLGNINTPEKIIWTAEDPVEITQQGLNQVQMLPAIGLNFAAALRSFLRADPDVIMIGEMRDAETAQIGIEASLTGHLVLSTLHTNSAAETVTRLLDLGIDSVNFSDALLGILAQRLVRTLCKCKEAYEANEEEFKMLKRHYGEEHFDEVGVKPGSLKLHIPKGCDECGNTGYKGRTGIHELLVSTPEVRELVYNNATATEIHNAAMKGGMRTLMQDGIVKVVKGQTDINQLIKVAAS